MLSRIDWIYWPIMPGATGLTRRAVADRRRSPGLLTDAEG